MCSAADLPSVTFRSKVDWWVRVLLVAAAIPPLVAIIATAIDGSPLRALLFSPVLLVTVGLPLWLVRSTAYTFDGDVLTVRSGPFVWRVPLRDIRRVTPTRNPLSSPALSLDRLRIDYGTRSLLISPEDGDRFLEELRRRLPDTPPSR